MDPRHEQALTIARERWPSVAFDAVWLQAHPEAADDFLPELLLAQACAHDTPGAIEAVERDYFGELQRLIKHEPDVEQQLREKLFVGAEPRIGTYAGLGPLKLWLKVAALRLTQNLATRGPRDEATLDSLAERLPGPGADPELDLLRKTYGAQFRDAFKQASASLGPEDRLLLEQRFLHRQSQEALAKSYGVHVNTVARWLAKARDQLEAKVRDHLTQQAGIPEEQLTSVLRLVRSQLDVSL